MLGSVKETNRWHWTAYGKHPVAKDFFSLGQSASVLEALTDWVDQGYRTLASKRSPSTDPSSWRFWTKGAGEGNLLCGLIKQSTDRVGRPYPLLLSGMGPVRGWEEQWDLIPFACERSWNQMERISTKAFENVSQLDAEIHRISPPSPHWSDYVAEREDLGKGEFGHGDEAHSQMLSNLEKQTAMLADQPEIFVSLDEEPSRDLFTLVSIWHFSMRRELKAIPNAVFMGGTLAVAYLAVFQRPLIPSDFVRLWSLDSRHY